MDVGARGGLDPRWERFVGWRRGSGPSRAADGTGGQIVSADALYWNRGLIEAGLSQARELKLLVILAAYLQSDLIRDRLRGPGSARRPVNG